PPLSPSHPPTLSLHDALPIWPAVHQLHFHHRSEPAGLAAQTGGSDSVDKISVEPLGFFRARCRVERRPLAPAYVAIQGELRYHQDRKSTRLNSSHQIISYAVF